MSFGWKLIINGVIGVIMIIVMIAVLVLKGEQKFGNDAMNQGFDDMSNFSDDYYKMMDPKTSSLVYSISAIVTVFAWEIVLPIVFYYYWSAMEANSKK